MSTAARLDICRHCDLWYFSTSLCGGEDGATAAKLLLVWSNTLIFPVAFLASTSRQLLVPAATFPGHFLLTEKWIAIELGYASIYNKFRWVQNSMKKLSIEWAIIVSCIAICKILKTTLQSRPRHRHISWLISGTRMNYYADNLHPGLLHLLWSEDICPRNGTLSYTVHYFIPQCYCAILNINVC